MKGFLSILLIFSMYMVSALPLDSGADVDSSITEEGSEDYGDSDDAEEEEEDEDMYIYEGDVLDDTMPEVYDEELDEDDMDRMNEEY